MASSRCKVNRRAMRRIIKRQNVVGADLRACAINIAAPLGLHASCTQKVTEILEALESEGQIILTGTMLRLTTEDEQRTAQEIAAAARKRQKRTRRRTAAKRSGGHRGLRLRTTLPLPAKLT